jgi:Transposase and inactivated derivatives
VELSKRGFTISRRRIGRIMADAGLVSNYTVKQFKVNKTEVNEDPIKNEVNREFKERSYKEVVVSDLTYVRVANTWHYICVLLVLSNREIIGYSAGADKTAKLVKQAFLKVDVSLETIKIFHTDRGSEFKNKVIDEMLETFSIKRSLRAKGTG